MSTTAYRVELLKRASARVQHTASGLPVGFYRVDLLPPSPPVPQSKGSSPLKARQASSPADIAADTNRSLGPYAADENDPQGNQVGGAAFSSDSDSSPVEGQAQNRGWTAGAEPSTGSQGLMGSMGSMDAELLDKVEETTISPPDTRAETSARIQQELLEAQFLQAAFVELSFDQGYPTLPDGRPFWHKMDFEPGMSFAVFQIFLELGESDVSVRDIASLLQSAEVIQVLTPLVSNVIPAELRSSAEPSALERIERQNILESAMFKLVQDWYILYHWKPRSRAYDMYREAAYRQIRVKRAMRAEDYHYTKADEILKMLAKYIGSEGFMAEMTPRIALDSLVKLMQIQRVSAGLPGGAPLTGDGDSTQVTDLEVLMRSISQKNTAYTVDEGGKVVPDEDILLGEVLKDPDTVRSMQEVIIRMSTSIDKGTSPTRFGAIKRGQTNNRAPDIVDAEPGISVDADDFGINTGTHNK